MKKLLLILISLSSIFSYSQCMLNADFTFVTSGGTVSFTNTSTNEPVIPYYQWDYDGQSSTLENPTFTLASTDQYACFTVYDSTWTCYDSLCVLIPGDSTACNLNISWTQSISGGNITFTNTSTNEPASPQYAWLYDGQTSSLENPTFPYDSTVTQVCFAIYGATNPSCQDSICGTVYPDSTGGCNLVASFTHTVGGASIFFSNTSTNEPAGAMYSWTFHGQTSNLEDPTFTQEATDGYACLTVYDSTWNCYDSTCVFIPGFASCNLVASFTHTVGGASIFFSNTSTNEPTGAMYSWTFHGQTSNLEDPIFTQEATDGYACLTVYDSTWSCYDSTCVFIPGYASCNLIADFTFTIDSGFVYFTNTSSNEPASPNYDWWYAGQSSSLENPVFYLDSGITYACLTVFDSSWNCYDSTCFVVDPATANLDGESEIVEASIYPNPVSEQLFVSIDSQHEIGLIEIYDASGRLVYSENTTNYTSNICIDVNDLKSGMYIINIQGLNDNIRYTERFLKR